MLGILLTIWSWINPITWFKLIAVKLGCFLFHFTWYEGAMNKCLNKRKKEIVMINKLEQEIKDIKENQEKEFQEIKNLIKDLKLKK